MIVCGRCGEETPETRNFCVHCKHKIRDLSQIRLGHGCRRVPSVDYFWETGDPSVFAKPGAPDYDPALAEKVG